MSVLTQILVHLNTPSKWVTWGSSANLKPGQSATIGAGMGPYFSVLGIQNGAHFENSSILNTTLQVNGIAEQEFYIAGNQGGRYMAMVSNPSSSPMLAQILVHLDNPPKWATWGSSANLKPGQSATIGAGMGPYFEVLGVQNGVHFENLPFVNTTLKTNGVAQQEFYIAGNRYMAIISQAYITEDDVQVEIDDEQPISNSKL